MKLFYSDTFELPLPQGHRFPMSKYRLLRERIHESDLQTQCSLLVPPAATDDQLRLVHDREYIARVSQGTLTDLEIRRIGFPWSEKMVERSRRSVGGSIAASLAAIESMVACNLAGGTHHAFPDAGQGYCIFNDTVVAARVLQQQGLIDRALFVDCDVHQGNGTAAVTSKDNSLFSFSLHCEKNFPFRKSQSDIDIALEEGSGDEAYLGALQIGIAESLRVFQPDIVFYLAGADPFAGDRLGKLNVSKTGLAKRDTIVFDRFRECDIPVAVSMAGGYAPQIDDIVDIHFQTVRSALQRSRPMDEKDFFRPTPSIPDSH